MARGRRTQPYTYLHRDAVLEGDLRVEGRVRVDGTLRGALRAGGTVEVAPGGRVEGGPVHGADVRVAGTVVGEVHASGRVEIWRGGVVDGDVHASALDVERGARLHGRSVMPEEAPEGADAPERPAAPATPAAPAIVAGVVADREPAT